MEIVPDPIAVLTGLRELLRRTTPKTRREITERLHQVLEGNMPPSDDFSGALIDLLEQSQFQPGLPLQVWGHPSTLATQCVEDLGQFTTVAEARHAAVEHYFAVEQDCTNVAGQEIRLQHIDEQLLFRLELRPTVQFSASLPDQYEFELDPVHTAPGGRR